MVYGYCRISTPKQNIERQIWNIKKEYPEAVIVSETFTGLSQDRPEWNKLFRKIKAGDIIVFDEVSRMSRNAREGFDTYKILYEKNVDLVFLKETYMNTDSYKNALSNVLSVDAPSGDSATDNLINSIMGAINKFILNKIESDIYQAFESAQRELDYLHQRTREGIEIARLNGKQIGRKLGTKIETKKSIESKAQIQKYNKDFGGSLSDSDCIRLIGISRNSYYKYKKELKNA